jgi:hypothetical protein
LAPKPLSQDVLQTALDALAANHGNVTAAARSLGINRSTFQHQAEEARRAGLAPDLPPQKPRIRVPARSSYIPQPETHGEAVRVVVWGCAHDSPGIPDKSRFRNVGSLASELRPDFIIDLGDTLDMDSMSSHAMPGSMDDRARSPFLTEIASLQVAIEAFDSTAPRREEIPRFHLHGNHENRAFRFEANNPASEGVYTLPLEQLFAQYGFTTRAYREWQFIADVGFTHAPINGMGKEVAGKFPDQMVSQEATHSVVWSHTHKSVKVNRPKFGVGNAIQVFNTGSFMPQGFIKQYAGLSMTGWTYGAHELTLRDGQIESVRTWSELELRERFA